MTLSEYDVVVAYLPRLIGRVLKWNGPTITKVKVTAFEVRERRRARKTTYWVDISTHEWRKKWGILLDDSHVYRVWSTSGSDHILPEAILREVKRLHARDVIGRLATRSPAIPSGAVLNLPPLI